MGGEGGHGGTGSRSRAADRRCTSCASDRSCSISHARASALAAAAEDRTRALALAAATAHALRHQTAHKHAACQIFSEGIKISPARSKHRSTSFPTEPTCEASLRAAHGRTTLRTCASTVAPSRCSRSASSCCQPLPARRSMPPSAYVSARGLVAMAACGGAGAAFAAAGSSCCAGVALVMSPRTRRASFPPPALGVLPSRSLLPRPAVQGHQTLELGPWMPRECSAKNIGIRRCPHVHRARLVSR